MVGQNLRKFLGFLSGVFGISVLMYVFLPIALYEADAFNRASYLSPIPSENGIVDYTKASNWFTSGKTSEEFTTASNVSYYTITIPRLNIVGATVAIGGEDLSESLIQYPGTALPGKLGNTVIFGHSILPQFYDPKNYLAIFSTLPTLKKGDQVQVNYDGITYTYEIYEMFEVSPESIDILGQTKKDSYISLITCTPPGDPRKPRRLVVRAKIIPYEQTFRN